jgi:hypothetical protein
MGMGIWLVCRTVCVDRSAIALAIAINRKKLKLFYSLWCLRLFIARYP